MWLRSSAENVCAALFEPALAIIEFPDRFWLAESWLEPWLPLVPALDIDPELPLAELP